LTFVQLIYFKIFIKSVLNFCSIKTNTLINLNTVFDNKTRDFHNEKHEKKPAQPLLSIAEYYRETKMKIRIEVFQPISLIRFSNGILMISMLPSSFLMILLSLKSLITFTTLMADMPVSSPKSARESDSLKVCDL